METPTHFLPAHVYVCASQDQGFFLDLKRNQYLSTTLQELSGLSRRVHGWPADLGGDAREETAGELIETTITELTRNQLLSRKPSRARKALALPCPPAQKALLEQGLTRYPAVFRLHLLSFSKAVLIAKYCLSVRSLYSTVRRIERRRTRHARATQPRDLQAMRSLVEIFRRLRPLLPPTHTPCLVNSVALIEFLAAHGQFPRLVFGVQAHPFGAHCWVQHDDIVLNSSVGEVLQFTPIMAA